MKRIIFLFFLMAAANMHAQISDDFSDGNLSNPDWIGNTEIFVVNDDQVLQLNDVDKGDAGIFVETNISGDIEWYVDVFLNFSPSSSNYGKIFIAMDKADIGGSGYYLKMGASGSSDAIELHKLENGSDKKIASGTAGAIASKPNVRLKTTYVDGVLEVFPDYDKTGFFPPEPEISVRINDLNPKFFGLGGKYTKSNANKFFFDNVIVQEYTPDTEGPKLLSAKVKSSTEVILCFDESIDTNSIQKENFAIKNGGANVVDAYPGERGNEVILKFDNPFSAQGTSVIQVASIRDQKGNISTDLVVEFAYLKAPEKGSVVINEILTDPVSGGYDFIELYNPTDFNVTLQGCLLTNTLNNKSKTIGNITLKGKSYVAFTKDVADLKERYTTPNEANIIAQEIPSMNNDEANMTIINVLGDTLDTFLYKEDFHLSILDDTEGVSLEKINPEGATQDESNWHSAAASTNFATPGYKNSAFVEAIESSDKFTLVTKSFSPNTQDAKDDFMVLQYNLDKPGYVSTIKIYDSNGYHVKTLHNNELLSTQGTITWDGQDKTGRIVNLGIYILVGEAFHNDGDVEKYKLAVSVLDYLN